MADAGSYRESHTDTGRGRRYDRFYATDPWVKFLWFREQQVLEDILHTYFAGGEVNLLDFACGTGRIAGFLESRVATAVGVDISEPMLEAARQNLKRTELISADHTRDPVLQGRRFNLITAFRFFTNAEPELRREALKGLVPLLAEDGCLVFNNHRNRSSPTMVLGHAVQTRPAGPHIRVMSIAEMRNLVAPFGLEMVKVVLKAGFVHARGGEGKIKESALSDHVGMS